MGVEWLLAARPERNLDAAPGSEDAGAYWSRWPTLSAPGMVVEVPADVVTLPGPHLDRAVAWLSSALGPAGP
ncbi:MAG: hypothetical protein ACQGVC_16155 [Myxococcota bacterium]